jgi:hypothetical protein
MLEAKGRHERPFVLVQRRSGYGGGMAEERKDELTPEELEREEAELLPDREEMTILPIEPTHGAGFTLPIEPPPTE